MTISPDTSPKLNALDPSMTRIDGLGIHFLHLRSPEPDAVPLVMTHGWLGSVFEFLKAVPLLADPRAHGGDPKDAFHVVLPTLSGFGLSEKPTQPGWTPERIAQAWVVLMQRLGYGRFVAQGGDWGYAIANALGGIGAPAVQAVHFNMFPIYETKGEGRALKRLQDFKDNEIGYALTDPPAGQAAWFYDKYEQSTDHDGEPERVLSRDEMLDNITLYRLSTG